MLKFPEIILGVETSCDDTCVAVVKDGKDVLSNVISSQEIHTIFGGVVPEEAARKHVEQISQVTKLALEKANLTLEDIEGIAVTNRHGLISSLLVGVSFAKSIAFAKKLPLIGIHHIEGHIYANFLENNEIELPHICLTISGGHTLLILVKNNFQYEIIGQTLDDAVGEAFDKVARYLGLGFPGGPIIDKLAKNNTEEPFYFTSPMLKSKDFLFSFSGIKTALRYHTQKLEKTQMEKQIPAIVAGFQDAVVKVLIEKSIRAAKEHNIKTITLSGGVAANSQLRKDILEASEKEGIKVFYPSIKYCTDNAAMIAGLAYHKFKLGEEDGFELSSTSISEIG